MQISFLQNEYRQALQNSDILSDFSFLVIMGQKVIYFIINWLNENVVMKLIYKMLGDNYLKTHKPIDIFN